MLDFESASSHSVGRRLALEQGFDMIIGDRLRAFREQKNLSQGDIEKRTGLLLCYISRVENNHTVPAIETLEKMARALEIPLYQIFYDGQEPPKISDLAKRRTKQDTAWGHSGRDGRLLDRFRKLLSRTSDRDRKLLLFTAQRIASKSKRATSAK
jgi:transcriptional regulator with XRE-family HTH domain